MSETKLQLYGTDWCTKSSALRNYLQSKWIEFDDFNVETNPDAEAKIKALFNGVLKFPTVIFRSDFIKNPSIPELNRFLEKHNIS